MNNNLEMMNLELAEGITVNVDHETGGKLLEDPAFAASYLRMVRQALEIEQEQDENIAEYAKNKECTLWKSKYPSKLDHQATLAFLALRKSLHHQFNDKKVPKNNLWSKIRDKMNEMGYFVGEGILGREKCRQKFSNLQSSYFKFKEKQRRTGEGKIGKPPYCDELDDILGDRHNTQPLLVIDSALASTKYNSYKEGSSELNSSNCIPSTSQCKTTSTIDTGMILNSEDDEVGSSSCTASTPITSKLGINRFAHNKVSVKPPTARNKALDELVQIQRENQKERQNEFKAMMEFFNNQSGNRHQEMMALLSNIKNTNEKPKRKRDDFDRTD